LIQGVLKSVGNDPLSDLFNPPAGAGTRKVSGNGGAVDQWLAPAVKIAESEGLDGFRVTRVDQDLAAAQAELRSALGDTEVDRLFQAGRQLTLADVADIRIHSQTKARPIDRHAEERSHLGVTPGLASSSFPYFAIKPLIFLRHVEVPEGVPVTVEVGGS
jgi:hypothetical protein